MTSFTIRKTVDSETLHVPELKPFIGKEIEITFRETPQIVVDRYAVLEQIAQMDLLDLDAIRKYDEFEMKVAKEALQ